MKFIESRFSNPDRLDLFLLGLYKFFLIEDKGVGIMHAEILSIEALISRKLSHNERDGKGVFHQFASMVIYIDVSPT